MASISSQRETHHNQFPPSPPPSPPATKVRHRKKVDPFEELTIDTASFELPPPPNEPTEESQLRNLILTPLLFVAFLVSLFLVNLRDRARRHKEHSRPSSILTYLYPSSWLDHEPYQDPADSSWSRRNSTAHVEPHDAISPRVKSKQEPWHLHKKIRQVTKIEITDAFELRSSVLVGMIVMMVMSFAMTCTSLLWVGGHISAFLFGK